MVCTKLDGVIVNGMGCYFLGSGVRLEDGVFVNGLECYYTGWGVSKRDGVLVNGNGMGC